MAKILLTGGAGFIGSHAVVAFTEAGHDVVVLDNFSNSKPQVLEQLQRIIGRAVPCVEGDINDEALLHTVFKQHSIDAVVHFAGAKAVGESVLSPLKYYHNNVSGTVTLFRVMAAHGVTRMVFSSSATVYGEPQTLPIPEAHPVQAVNPYGRTKLMVEEILQDVCAADSEWSVSLLRYFNPVGAHGSGLIGEDPQGIPNNLMPYILRVADGQYPQLSVFGDDYDTPDGSGVRDYIHVMDLAEGHVKALERIEARKGCHVHNLGTGKGTSVLELVKAFETANGVEVPCAVVPRRPGDVAACWADPARAEAELGWKASRSIEEMCRDAWHALHTK